MLNIIIFFYNIESLQLIFTRFKTSRLKFEIFSPHKDQLLVFYIHICGSINFKKRLLAVYSGKQTLTENCTIESFSYDHVR